MRHINFCRNSVQQVQVRPWWQKCSSRTLASQLRSTATSWSWPVSCGLRPELTVSSQVGSTATVDPSQSNGGLIYIYIPSIPVLLCGVTYKNIVDDITSRKWSWRASLLNQDPKPTSSHTHTLTSHIINPTWRYVKETVHTVWPEFICNFACRIYVVGGRGDELSGLNQSVNQSVN